MEGWVKLHRKALENDLITDTTAWAIFCWILLKVDRRTGKMTLGRFWASKELGLKPITFYKALKRLEKVYKTVSLVTKKVTIKYTEVSVLNWDKYQSKNVPITQDDNNPVTIQEQSDNTLQEVKNKEIKKEEEEEKIPNRLSLNRSQYMIFLKEFPGLTTGELKDQIRECNAYMIMSSFNTYNPGLFFRKWMKRYVEDKKRKKAEEEFAKKTISSLPVVSEEEKQRNLEKMKQMRKDLSSKLRWN